MQTGERSGVLQAGVPKREESIPADDGRETIHRVPTNHRQAERKLIGLVEQGILEIDGRGRIWRLQVWKGNKLGGRQLIKVKRRRAENKARGYLQVRAVIEERGRRVHSSAHRLVWRHFFGDIPDGLCINHRNGDKADNHPANLEVVTYSENRKHGFRTGLINQDGERNPRASVTNEQAKKIREDYATEEVLQIEIALDLDIPYQTVSRIIRGEIYASAGGPIDQQDHRGYFSGRDPKTGRFCK